MHLVKLTIFCFVFVMGVSVHASEVETSQLEEHLLQAQKFQNVKPAKSLKLLEYHKAHIRQLSNRKQFEWYLTTAKSAVYVNRVDLVYSNLFSASQFDFSQLGNSRVIGYLGVAGHHLIQTGHLELAQTAYRCAVNQLENPHEALSLIISLAISHLQLGNHDMAKEYFSLAVDMARKNGNADVEAVVLNSIGVTLLSDNKYLEAQGYFKQAMALHQHAGNTSNQILTGENLLLSFVLSRDFSMFERLYPRIQRLMGLEEDNDKNTYLKFIHAAFTHIKTGQIDEVEKVHLHSELKNVKSQLIAQPIEKYLLPVLDMETDGHLSESADEQPEYNSRSYAWFTDSVPCKGVDISDEVTLKLLSNPD